MPIIYEEDFDELPEGQSPPSGWIKSGLYPPDICEVDDAQYHSSPHSTKLYDAVSSGYCRREEAGGFTDDRVIKWLYFNNANTARNVLTQATAGDRDNNELLAFIGFRQTGDIMYYVNAWQDTGYNFSVGWHKLEIVHDLGNDCFDAWYDEVKIIAGGAYYTGITGKTIVKTVHVAVYCSYLWFDDVQIGEGGGCTVSPAQAGPMSGGVTI